jgi:hypothetical protein
MSGLNGLPLEHALTLAHVERVWFDHIRPIEPQE